MSKQNDMAPQGGKPPRRATLRTIAEMTGLSLSTVSLSLRGGTTLKQETRDKVHAAAKALGYVPDRAGVRLRTGKTNVLALVLDGAEDSIDFARQMIQGIGQAIGGTQYHLNVVPEFERHLSADTIRHVLDNRTADGVIITHTGPQDQRVAMMMDAGFPFVSHGRTQFEQPHPFHDFDSEAFARMAVDRLAEKGCRRVMLVIGDDRTTNHHNILSAFRQRAAERGVGVQVMDDIQGMPVAELRRVAREIGSGAERPDGIISDSEMRTISLVSGLADAGLVLGRDVQIVYKQTSGILPMVYPEMDSIREDVFAAGVELTQLLLRRIEGVDAGELQTLAEPVAQWRG
jgi:LacI family transcriptional regulator